MADPHPGAHAPTQPPPASKTFTCCGHVSSAACSCWSASGWYRMWADHPFCSPVLEKWEQDSRLRNKTIYLLFGNVHIHVYGENGSFLSFPNISIYILNWFKALSCWSESQGSSPSTAKGPANLTRSVPGAPPPNCQQTCQIFQVA